MASSTPVEPTGYPSFSQTAAGEGKNPTRQDQNPEPSKTRREKYAARACDECKSRKVKCDANEPCMQCRARKVLCTYASTSYERTSGTKPKTIRKPRSIRSANSSPRSRELQSETLDQAEESTKKTIQARISAVQREIQEIAKLSQSHLSEPQASAIDSSRNRENLNVTLDDSNSPSMELPSTINIYDAQTDSYDVASLQSRSLALGSQLANMRRLLGLGSRSNDIAAEDHLSNKKMKLQLPESSRLRYLLDVYFDQFNSFIPYLDRAEIEHRIYNFLGSMHYNDTRTNLQVESSQFSLGALICNMLAIGEFLDPEQQNTSTSRPGWSLYLQGCNLIQHYSSAVALDLDVIRSYGVGAGYLMHSQCLRASLHLISLAVQAANKVKLNDQKAWPNCSEQEIVSRKKLWWSLYFMDRRMSHQNGIPYLIRDTEVDVDDFRTKTRNKASIRLASDGVFPTRHPLDNESFDYIQSLVDIGRIWSQIWDKFFSANANKLGQWQEIEIMDVRIKALQRQLPQSLVWNQEIANRYAQSETELETARRLSNLTRINTLRLIIRQNPLVDRDFDDLETKRACAALASETIAAIAFFNNIYPNRRSIGYFITAALIECICQLVPLLQAACLPDEKSNAIGSVRVAYRTLVDMSRTTSGGERALKALKNVISVDNSVSTFKYLMAENEQDIVLSEGGSQPMFGQEHESFDLPSTMDALQWPSSLASLDYFSFQSDPRLTADSMPQNNRTQSSVLPLEDVEHLTQQEKFNAFLNTR